MRGFFGLHLFDVTGWGKCCTQVSGPLAGTHRKVLSARAEVSRSWSRSGLWIWRPLRASGGEPALFLTRARAQAPTGSTSPDTPRPRSSAQSSHKAATTPTRCDSCDPASMWPPSTRHARRPAAASTSTRAISTRTYAPQDLPVQVLGRMRSDPSSTAHHVASVRPLRTRRKHRGAPSQAPTKRLVRPDQHSASSGSWWRSNRQRRHNGHPGQGAATARGPCRSWNGLLLAATATRERRKPRSLA